MQLTASRLALFGGLAVSASLLVWLALSGTLSALYTDFLTYIFNEQRAFHTAMTNALGEFAKTSGLTTGWAIVTGSFLYGVFHAAGPGHGKVILSTYLLTQPEKVRKSVMLATLSALVQGAVAIALVYGLFYLFGLVSRDMKLAVAWSERLAFGLVMVIGAVLIWRALRGFGLFRAAKPAGTEHDHDHHHHDHSGHGHEDHQHHHHHGDGHVCSTCGHAHALSADQVDSASDLRSTIGVILSIGLRPCSGAVLVLVFARFSDIPWAGVMSVLAMSLGTAITVSAIAAFAVQARSLAMSTLGSATGIADKLGYLLAFVGGSLLLLFGWGLMQSSFDAPVRSMGL